MARLLFFTGLTVKVSGDDVHVVESETLEDGVTVRTALFKAQLDADEMLVLHCERRENERVVLTSEEIYGSAAVAEGVAVRLRRLGFDCWQILGGGVEQYLQGVAVAKWEAAAGALHLAFTPDLLRERRRYSVTWRATVEKWSVVQGRHPELSPADAPAEHWPVRSMVYPAIAGGR